MKKIYKTIVFRKQLLDILWVMKKPIYQFSWLNKISFIFIFVKYDMFELYQKIQNITFME